MLIEGIVSLALVSTACTTGDQMPTCTITDGRADARCTPGALNPDVTQATIGQTICVPGWSDRVRPPTSYTTPLKRRQMVMYGVTGRPLADYREDHLIAQGLGGALTDPANLWPQPVAPSRVKDQDANRLRREVCAGRLPLADAQRQLVHRWTH